MALEFRCKDVGVVCRASIKADSEEELVHKIADHAADVHRVPELTQTLVDYAKTTVKETR